MIKSNLLIATSSLNYTNQALDELRLLDKGLKAVGNLGNGMIVLEPALDKHEFNRIVVQNKPVFVRHINTVDYIISTNGEVAPRDIIQTIDSYDSQILKGFKVAVQIRKANAALINSPLEIKRFIDEYISEKYCAVPVIKEPDKVISILAANDKCYIGISDVSSNLSSWSGGMIHYKKDDNDISRAKFKLMEAIYVFDINMTVIGSALDLGAAPGGWTSVLLDYGIAVTAVDTGDMDQRLLENENLSFIKGNVSDVKLSSCSFDMLTSDISWNPINTAKMAVECSDALKADGIAVVTVKLMNSKIGRTIKGVKNIYSEKFDILGAKQLFHNRDEITLYMKKR